MIILAAINSRNAGRFSGVTSTWPAVICLSRSREAGDRLLPSGGSNRSRLDLLLGLSDIFLTPRHPASVNLKSSPSGTIMPAINQLPVGLRPRRLQGPFICPESKNEQGGVVKGS